MKCCGDYPRSRFYSEDVQPVVYPLPPPPAPPVIVSPSSLLHDLQSIFHNRSEFSDLDISVGGKTFSAHRIVCCARSKYLRDKIMEGHAKLDLGDLCSPEIFLIVLQYLYTASIGEIKEVEQLCKVAERMELMELVTLCHNTITGEGWFHVL